MSGLDDVLCLEVVHLRSTTGGEDPAAAEVLRAARAHGVIGAVVEQAAVELVLPLDAGGRVLQLVRGQVVSGPLGAVVIDRIARGLGAVAEDVDQPEDGDGPDEGHPGPERASGELGRVVTAFRTRRAVDRDLALEVALIAQSEVAVVREGAWTVAVHGPSRDGLDLQPWPGSMRPAVALVHREGEGLLLEAHLPRRRDERAADGVRGWQLRTRWRRRVLEHALPSWSWLVLPARTEPLVDVAAHPELDDGVRRQLLELQGQPEPSWVAEALGLDAFQRDHLAAVLREPYTSESAHAVVAALGLPDVVARLSARELRADDLPQAVRAHAHGAAGTVVETVLARPEGSDWLSRLRRLDHDRPWLSVLFIVGEVALGAALAARALGAFGPPLPTVWAVLLGVGAGLCALDAVGNAVVFAALRRRRATGLPPGR